MSEDNAKGAARPSQPETNFHDDITISPSAGVLPLAGRFADFVWAARLKVKPQTIRDLVKKHNIVHKRIGDCVVIEADQFWLAFPDVTPLDSPKSKRGGARRKKGV